MSKVYSPELKFVINEALDSAELLEKELSSLHLLFALYMVEDNTGGLFLSEEGCSDRLLTPHVDESFPESPDASEEIMEFAEEISSKYRSREVNCLHLVVALLRHRRTIAFNALEKAGVSIAKLRTRAISLLVDMPESYSALFRKNRVNNNASTASAPSTMTQSSSYKPAAQPRSSTVVASTSAVNIPQNTVANTNRQAHSGSINRENFPVLHEVAIDMVEEARSGRVEPVVGRRQEMEELTDILNKRKANNPLIIGPSGVGKTAIVEGLAFRLAFEPESLPGFEGRRLFQLDASQLLKGTHLRGSLSSRMDALRTEVASARNELVLFIDEIHTLSQGSVDGAQDIAQELKSSLARGEFPCIGATTSEEYQKTIERDSALSRRFHLLEVDEPDENDTIMILASVADDYEQHHKVEFEPLALKLAVTLSNRYMRDRKQPDKALTILDLAGSMAKRTGSNMVSEKMVASVVSKLTSVPVDQLIVDETSRYLNLETELAKSIIGHKDVLACIAESLRRNVAGFGGERPMGSFLFVGPTGVGKTEIAKSLAAELFGNASQLIRLDMSEFSEAHAVAKLIGAPPGYVGYQEGGVLTDAIRRHPFQIVLFDEIEKAHPDAHQLLLQVLDDGRLTDNLGRTVDFTHTVIIMTSNLGANAYQSKRQGIGFSNTDSATTNKKQQVLQAVKSAFAPELYNRIDEKIVFDQLSKQDILAIAGNMLKASAHKLLKEKRISLTLTKGVAEALADGGGHDPLYGARPMRRAIQSKIEGPLASLILSGKILPGDKVLVRASKSGRFHFDAVN